MTFPLLGFKSNVILCLVINFKLCIVFLFRIWVSWNYRNSCLLTIWSSLGYESMTNGNELLFTKLFKYFQRQLILLFSTATSQPQQSNSSEPPPIPVRRIPPSTQTLLSSSPSSSSDHHHHHRHHQSMLVKSDSISEKNVLQLCSEGFERVNVLNALARTNNNLCLARRLLSEAGCGTRA